MTDHEPGTMVGIIADKVQVAVPNEHVHDENSYRVIASPNDDAPTVTVEAGKTRFEYRGETWAFDGYIWHPESDYRPEYGDGRVRLKDEHGHAPDENHRLYDLDFEGFAEMLADGTLTSVAG